MRAAFLIHGFMTDREDFARIVPILRTRYDFVLCPDLPFHSPTETKTQMDAATVVSYVEHTFDKLSANYSTIDVIGFSMGGALALHLSKTRRINNLVLLAPAIKYISTTFLMSAAKYYLDNTISTNKPKPQQTQQISSFDEVKKDNISAAKMFLKQLLPRYTPKNLAEFTKVIKACNKNLKRVTPPTLIIWGKLDQLVPPSAPEYVFKLCTNPICQKKIYGDLSHYMLYSSSFFHIIDDILLFLEQNSPPQLAYGNN